VLKKVLHHKIRIAIILTVFIFYLLNGIGVLDINIRSGIDINFNSRVLASILSSSLSDPAGIQSLNLMLMLVIGLVLVCILPVLSPVYAALLTLAGCIPLVYLNIANTGTQLVLPMEYSLLIILVLFSLNALLAYFIETHSRQKIIHVFGQFVPPDIVSEIARHPESINMEGDSRRMTVFFCDLQDFSNVAEQMNPKQLTILLNEYFDAMTEILYRYGATIDKYIGDAIMAFWGAPLVQKDHAQRAVLAAFDMHVMIRQLSDSYIKRGWPGPAMGIGINTGLMNVGNMGSKYRITYTVIGDAVNLASRIETLTRTYHLPILVSESTRNECPDVVFREIDTVKVKGKHNITRIYQPMCRRSEMTESLESLLEQHQRGMQAYTDREFEKATGIFRKLQEERQDDGFYPAILRKINPG
jgi:adenylate cyclase